MTATFQRPRNLDAAYNTQRHLDAALGDADLADRLVQPLIVRELSKDEARRLWPQDFTDTVPTMWGDLAEGFD